MNACHSQWHTLKISYLTTTRRERKETSIDCLSQRCWLGIFRNWNFFFYMYLQWWWDGRWGGDDEDVQRICFYE